MLVQPRLVPGPVIAGIPGHRPRRLLERLQALLAVTRQNLATMATACIGDNAKDTPTMTPALRQIVFINTAHTITHYSLLILPTAVLAMAVPGGPFGESYGPILALANGMFVLYGLLSLPQGWLAQRFGRKILMTAFFLGIATGLIGAGLAHSPTMLAIALAFAGGFAAIYHPIGTTMLIEAAGDKPGSAIGLNGVFGNLGVALAPVVTAFLAHAVGWRAAFIVPGLFCAAVGLLWMRTPLASASLHVNRRPFPPIPRHLVYRAVLVLMLIAMSSGLVFNAFTLLLPKLLQERLAGNATLLPLVGLAAFLVTLCGALTQFSVGRMIDRNTVDTQDFGYLWPLRPWTGADLERRAGRHATVTAALDHTHVQEGVAGSIGKFREAEPLVGVVPFDDGLHRRTGGRFKPLGAKSRCRSKIAPGWFEVIVVESHGDGSGENLCLWCSLEFLGPSGMRHSEMKAE
jgi:MFS family permease